MEFNELIQERFSCRALSDAELPHAAMDRIIEAARVAPTAVNKQPFKIWAIESPEASAKIAETTNYTFGAGASSSSSAASVKRRGYAPTMDGTSPTWMPQSSQPTSCSRFTTRVCAQHGSDISTRPNSKRHSLRWRTTTSSPSSPSATQPKRASPPRATHSVRLLWRLWKYCRSAPHTQKPPAAAGDFCIRIGISYFVKPNARLPG